MGLHGATCITWGSLSQHGHAMQGASAQGDSAAGNMASELAVLRRDLADASAALASQRASNKGLQIRVAELLKSSSDASALQQRYMALMQERDALLAARHQWTSNETCKLLVAVLMPDLCLWLCLCGLRAHRPCFVPLHKADGTDAVIGASILHEKGSASQDPRSPLPSCRSVGTLGSLGGCHTVGPT